VKKLFIVILVMSIALFGFGIATAPDMTPGVHIASALPTYMVATPKTIMTIDILAVIGIAASVSALILYDPLRATFGKTPVSQRNQGANTTRRPGLIVS
jgi:hypothetical protein